MTCRHCATSCGARRRSRRVSPKRSPAERGELGDRLRRPANCRSSPATRSKARGSTPSDGRCPASASAIVSLDDGEPLSPGEAGEIQVRSDSVMAGYLPDSATAEAFSDGWYRTGDVGHLDAEGWLRITDRAKEMIKVRGFQVAPAEIEAVLHGHPSVEDCAVFGVPDAANGEAVVAAVKTCRRSRGRRAHRAGRRSAGVLQAAEPRGVRGRNTAPAIGKGVASSAEGAAVDVRLTSEQQQLREAAAKLADDLGPGSVADLDDASRIARLEKAVDATGFRTLRSDGASGVEVAIVAEEFARGLVDVPFLGPVLADDLRRALGRKPSTPTSEPESVDLTRSLAGVVESPPELSELSEEDAGRWHALALAVTCADLVGAARGTHALACEYAKVREQYGSTIGSYQAVGICWPRAWPSSRAPSACCDTPRGRSTNFRSRRRSRRRGWPRSTLRVRH